MADGNSTRACAHCGSTIVPRINKTTGQPSKAERRYCNSRCCWTASDARRGPKRYRPPAIRALACHGCGISVMRRMRRDESGRYCSRTCNTHALARVAAERSALARIATAWAWRPSALVVAETAALRRIARNTERQYRTLKPCTRCQAPTIGLLNWNRKCRLCRAEENREAARKDRQSPSGRARRKMQKAIRRARCAIAAEKIDPIAVFERDKWICRLCGIGTPRRLRGTYQPNAPELDHIIPLALGGGHTWGNVQCACRACNGKKGATVKGQLGLPLVA